MAVRIAVDEDLLSLLSPNKAPYSLPQNGIGIADRLQVTTLYYPAFQKTFCFIKH